MRLTVPILYAFVAANSLISASPRPAAATYDPRHGRWLQRDPLQPPRAYGDGGSVFEYCRSRPTAGGDPDGTRFIRIGKGPLPMDTDPPWSGGTSLVYLTPAAHLAICDDGMTNRVKLDEVYTLVSYWWVTLDDRDHELHHSDIWHSAHNGVESDIQGLEALGCMCPPKAGCYYNLMPKFVEVRKYEADVANDEWDIQTYPPPPWPAGVPDLNGRLEYWKEQLNRARKELRDGLLKCQRL